MTPALSKDQEHTAVHMYIHSGSWIYINHNTCWLHNTHFRCNAFLMACSKVSSSEWSVIIIISNLTEDRLSHTKVTSPRSPDRHQTWTLFQGSWKYMYASGIFKKTQYNWNFDRQHLGLHSQLWTMETILYSDAPFAASLWWNFCHQKKHSQGYQCSTKFHSNGNVHSQPHGKYQWYDRWQDDYILTFYWAMEIATASFKEHVYDVSHSYCYNVVTLPCRYTDMSWESLASQCKGSPCTVDTQLAKFHNVWISPGQFITQLISVYIHVQCISAHTTFKSILSKKNHALLQTWPLSLQQLWTRILNVLYVAVKMSFHKI